MRSKQTLSHDHDDFRASASPQSPADRNPSNSPLELRESYRRVVTGPSQCPPAPLTRLGGTRLSSGLIWGCCGRLRLSPLSKDLDLHPDGASWPRPELNALLLATDFTRLSRPSHWGGLNMHAAS